LTVAAHSITPPPRKRQRFDVGPSSSSRESFPASLLVPSSSASPPHRRTLTSATISQSVQITRTSTSIPLPALVPAPGPVPALAPATPIATSAATSAVTPAEDQSKTLVWEPYSPLGVTARLSWDPKECHQIVSRAFPNPQYCVACLVQDRSLMRHLDQTQRRAACPLYSLDQAWQAFQLGWELTQKKGVKTFREEMVDIERYAYCGSCFIEACPNLTHGCVFSSHDREGCARRHDHDRRWFVRLAFLVLRQGLVRNQIANTLTVEDTSSWGAHQWGAWVSHPYTSHLSRASVVVSLYISSLK
jgi:hypothetical protein